MKDYHSRKITDEGKFEPICKQVTLCLFSFNDITRNKIDISKNIQQTCMYHFFDRWNA